MKNTKMSLSEFRMKINTSLLKRIGAGEEAITITSHGFPVARVGAINPAWDGRPFLDPVPTPSDSGEAIVWTTDPEIRRQNASDTCAAHNYTAIPSTSNTFTDSGDTSITLEEAVARQGPPPGYLTEEDIKAAVEDADDIMAAQEVEHEDTVSSEQAKKELGLEIPSRESLDRRYKNNLKNLSLEMLEVALTNTPPEETVGRAMLMTYIRNHRPFTATETEIYRQLMAQLRPPPSDDGT